MPAGKGKIHFWGGRGKVMKATAALLLALEGMKRERMETFQELLRNECKEIVQLCVCVCVLVDIGGGDLARGVVRTIQGRTTGWRR